MHPPFLRNSCGILLVFIIHSVENTGIETFDCQCLLHTYYSVPSIASTTVTGMKGYTGVESVTTGKRRGDVLWVDWFIEYVEADESISFTRETDVKFQNVNNPVFESFPFWVDFHSCCRPSHPPHPFCNRKRVAFHSRLCCLECMGRLFDIYTSIDWQMSRYRRYGRWRLQKVCLCRARMCSWL